MAGRLDPDPDLLADPARGAGQPGLVQPQRGAGLAVADPDRSPADYKIKFATVSPGHPAGPVLRLPRLPRMPELMAARAVDLSDHLSGAAVLDYPNLANLPTACWDVGRFNGGSTVCRPPAGHSERDPAATGRPAARRGITGEFSDFSDLAGICAESTTPVSGSGRWPRCRCSSSATCCRSRTSGASTQHHAELVDRAGAGAGAGGGPQAVRRRSGQPDAFAAPNKKTWFSTARHTSPTTPSPPGRSIYAGVEDESIRDERLHHPGLRRGGTGKLWLSFPSLRFSPPSASTRPIGGDHAPDRRLLAAPFGSAEYLTIRYGRAGVDYELNDGNPAPTGSTPARQPTGREVRDRRPDRELRSRPAGSRAPARRAAPPAGARRACQRRGLPLFKTVADRFAGSQTRFSSLENDILSRVADRSATGGPKPTPGRPANGAQMSAELTEAYHAAGRG